MEGQTMTLGLDEVRCALGASQDELTAEQLAVLRAAAQSWLVQEEALERAVVELRAFAAERGVAVRSLHADGTALDQPTRVVCPPVPEGFRHEERET